MLTRIAVDNYRWMVNFECQLRAKTLLLGPNGSGKSTLFDVLELLRDFSARGESCNERFLGDTTTRWTSRSQQSFELHVESSQGTYQYFLELDSVGTPARPRVRKELVQHDGKPVFSFEMGEVHLFNDRYEDKVQYPFDWHRSALATITERWDNTKLCGFTSWLRNLQCVSPDPRRMSALARTEAFHLDRDLGNFAEWYRHLKQELDDHVYLDDLRRVVEGLQTLRLEHVGEKRRGLRVAMKQKGGDYGFAELSDGQRALIGLYAVLHFLVQPYTTLCFDEPDNFLALKEILPWLEALLERVEDEESQAQILIISHHPEYLNQLAFTDGLRFDRDPDGAVRAKPFEDISCTGLPAAELVARGWDER